MNSSSDERFLSIKTGLLEFAVLRIIHGGDVYAADILKSLAPTPLHTQEGTLYPLLSKLRRDGLVEYEWRESDAGPPRKYYALTQKGAAQLEDLKEYWQKITGTISKLGK
jgi:PadR family transcriptional regulator PadR